MAESDMLTAHEKPSLTALKAFDATARHGSMSQAARHLHVTHGAISRQIRQLESQLGAALFVRAHGRLQLTDAGELLSHTTQEAFDAIDYCWQQLHDKERERPLLFGCTGSLLARWLIPRMEGLQQALPELRLHVVSTDQALAHSGNDVDAALMFLEPPWPTHKTVVTLLPERFGPVMAPELNTCSSAQALCQKPLLATASRRQAWPLWAQAQGIAPESLMIGQTFDHLYYLLEAAEAGLGVAISPDLLVQDAITRGRLVAPFGFMETNAQLCLVYTESLTPALSQRMNILKTWLLQHIPSV